MKERVITKPFVATTQVVNVYKVKSCKATFLSLKRELDQTLHDTVDKTEGSNWSRLKFVNVFAKTHAFTLARGSSHIQTPDQHKHPKCGVLNKCKDDQECFIYCMIYHQAEQLQNSHRMTVLIKMKDKCHYSDSSFPFAFGILNNLNIIINYQLDVYGMVANIVILIGMGNVIYARSEVVNLLLLVNNELDKAHDVYINNIDRLFSICKTTFRHDMQFCPYCNKGGKCSTH
jgi:hypothetical protein